MQPVIARELHAIVAESLTTMVVQAEAAQEELAAGRNGGAAALAAVEETGRLGLDEMRRLLAMLRWPGERADLEPQPTLERLPKLARDGVDVTVEGDRGRVAPGVDLAAHRLVEDALSVLDGGRARVVLTYGREDVRIVVDAPESRALLDAIAPAGPRAIGPSERVSLHGGWVEARSHGAGSSLRARLPRAGSARAGYMPSRRDRIVARELHDVLAHSMSVMIVQAAAAKAVAARDPVRAQEAARVIEQTGRDALAEVRRMLGILRRGDEDIALESQPTLLHVDALVRRARSAGLPVESIVEGSAERLPPGLDLTAYRVVQEALRNVLMHAPGARAELRVRYRLDTVEIQVVDDGRRLIGMPKAAGVGLGLAGLRERVSMCGGELSAGPSEDGGFSVRAVLPRRVSHPAGGQAAATSV